MRGRTSPYPKVFREGESEAAKSCGDISSFQTGGFQLKSFSEDLDDLKPETRRVREKETAPESQEPAWKDLEKLLSSFPHPPGKISSAKPSPDRSLSHLSSTISSAAILIPLFLATRAVNSKIKSVEGSSSPQQTRTSRIIFASTEFSLFSPAQEISGPLTLLAASFHPLLILLPALGALG